MTSKQQRARRYYLKHKDKVRASNDAWAKANPEAIRKHKRKWKKNNPESNRFHVKKYRKSHPGNVKKWNRTEYLNNCDDYKIRAKQYKYRKKSVAYENCSKKISLLSKECFCHWCCRKLNDLNRTIDHVIPLSRGGHHIPDNLVASCRSCNSSKHDKLVEEWTWEEAA